MVCRTAVIILTLSLCGVSARAAETEPLKLTIAPAADAVPAVPAAADVVPAVPVVATVVPTFPVPAAELQRPRALPVLYVSFAALQIFDGYSTTKALSSGGHESNPIMQGVAANGAALWTLKAVSTGASIFMAERLWRTHPVRAVVILAISNGFYAVVAANNARALHQLR